MKKKDRIIPVLKLNEITEQDNEKSIDYYYLINNKDDYDSALASMNEICEKYNIKDIWHDFKTGIRFQDKKWYAIGDVMIYENTNATDMNGLHFPATGYECAFCVSVIKQ